MLKNILIDELKSKSYEDIATEILKESGTVRERMFCNYMGFGHCNGGSGVDGVNWSTLSFVEIKTQYYNPNTKGGKKLTAKGMWGAISAEIYDKKCKTNEETYVIGLTHTGDVAFYFLFNFDVIKDEYFNALKRRSTGLTLSYNKFIKGKHLIYVNPDIENYKECIDPQLYALLTDPKNSNTFNEHIQTSKGKVPSLKKINSVNARIPISSCSSSRGSYSTKDKRELIMRSLNYLQSNNLPINNKTISDHSGIKSSTISKYWQKGKFIKD